MKERVRAAGNDLIDELRDCLQIDKHSLDTEIQQQPSLFFKISEAAVNAAARRDYCKEEIGRVDAELNAKHRRRIEKGGSRATDSAVSAAVLNDEKHQAAVDLHLKAKVKAELYLALKESFHQRSYMLRDLAALAIANYYEKTAITENSTVKDFRASKTIDKMAEARKAKGSLESRRASSKK